MSGLFDREFVVGMLTGAAIAFCAKLLKDLVWWVRNRKGKGGLSQAVLKALRNRLLQLLCISYATQVSHKKSLVLRKISEALSEA